MREMKVTHIVRQYTPSIGGMEEMVRSLAACQMQEGHISPHIITLNRIFRQSSETLQEREIVEGLPVTRISYSGSERYPFAPAVLAHIKAADIVHVHGIDFFFDFLALTKELHGKPLIASTHGGFFHTAFASRLKKIYFNFVTRLSSKAYSQIIATSKSDGDIFSQIISAKNLRIIENGVDIKKFANASSPELQPVIIYFGRWSENKGILESLDLLSAIRKLENGTNWKLIIAGRAYDLDSREIREHAKSLFIHNEIEIHESPSQERLRELIGRASYFICLSRHEGFGISPIEAMSAGLTPILNDIPPFEDLIRNTSRGILVSRSQIIHAAHRVDQLHSEQKIDHNFRKKNMECIKPYSWKHVQAKYSQAYKEILQPYE